jgi:hypothetical protein
MAGDHQQTIAKFSKAFSGFAQRRSLARPARGISLTGDALAAAKC